MCIFELHTMFQIILIPIIQVNPFQSYIFENCGLITIGGPINPYPWILEKKSKNRELS